MPQFFYNGYGFDENAVWFTIIRTPRLGGTNRRAYVDHDWYIEGAAYGANTAAVQAKMAAIENAMVDGGDLVFTLYHSLRSADCVSGTHVGMFQWSRGFDGVRGSGAELVLRRTFKARIYGRILAASDTDLIQYRESIHGIGDTGPIIIPVGSLVGDVQAQQTQLKTPWWAFQSGYAIGLTSTPSAATPIWQVTPGVYYDHPSVDLEIDTPISWGINQNTGFKIAWRYKCWSRASLMTSPFNPF